jgi:hypothetical protein
LRRSKKTKGDEVVNRQQKIVKKTKELKHTSLEGYWRRTFVDKALFFFLSYRQKGTKNEGRIDLLGKANALSLIVLNIAILYIEFVIAETTRRCSG